MLSNRSPNLRWWTEIRIDKSGLKRYMLSNRSPIPGRWTEIRIDKSGLKNVYAFNKSPIPGWWTKIRIDKSGLKHVYAFKQVSDSGLVDQNKNRQIWLKKCIFLKAGLRFQAGGPK